MTQRSRTARLALLVIAVALAATACQWRPTNIVNNKASARPCTPGIHNTFRIDPKDFTPTQINEMIIAVAYLRNMTGIPFTHEVKTVAATDKAGIVVRYGPIIQQTPSGPVRHNGYSPVFDDNQDGLYDRGSVKLDNWNNRYPSRGGWGVDYQENFFKLAVHEFSHQVGLDDMYNHPDLQVAQASVNNVMFRTSVGQPGQGDLEGWQYLGCPGGEHRAR